MTTHQRLIAARKEINRRKHLPYRAIEIDDTLQSTITLPEYFDCEKKKGLIIYDEMAQWEHKIIPHEIIIFNPAHQ